MTAADQRQRPLCDAQIPAPQKDERGDAVEYRCTRPGELLKRQTRAASLATAPMPATTPLTQPGPTPVHWGDG